MLPATTQYPVKSNANLVGVKTSFGASRVLQGLLLGEIPPDVLDPLQLLIHEQALDLQIVHVVHDHDVLRSETGGLPEDIPDQSPDIVLPSKDDDVIRKLLHFFDPPCGTVDVGIDL